MRTILSKFTLGKTLVTLFIASLMFWASTWQWERYKQKQVLVATFKTNTSREARSVPFDRLSASDPSTNRFEFRPSVEESEIISALRFHKVQLRGRYDYSKQVIVTNRRDPSGPGHHLMTPLLLEGENRAILVKRGFIPYEDRTAESFSKYDFPQEDSVKYAVFQEAVTPFLIGPQNPEIRTGAEFEHLWFYEEVAKMAKQLPYPVIQGAYVELLGGLREMKVCR